MDGGKRVSFSVSTAVLKRCPFTVEIIANPRTLQINLPGRLEIWPAQKNSPADLRALNIQSVALATFCSVVEGRISAIEIVTDLRADQAY